MARVYFLEIKLFLFPLFLTSLVLAQGETSYLLELESNNYNAVSLLERVDQKEVLYKTFCSGVIYDATTVLTASHCIQKCDWEECNVAHDAQDIKIMTGKGVEGGVVTAKNLSSLNILSVKRILANPYFESVGRYEWSSDIAILKLQNPLREGSFSHLRVFPAREISMENDLQEVKLEPLLSIIAGFGKRENENYKVVGSGQQQVRKTKGSNGREAPVEFYLNGRDWQLYARGPRSLFSVCKGDSGGPIFMKFEKTEILDAGWYLMGVLSTADFFRVKTDRGIIVSRCGLSEHTVIDYHMKWIDWVLHFD